MKVLHFPIPVSRVRDCLHKLGLWPMPESKNEKVYFADIKESYQKTILACHPDSREATSSTTTLPAVRDVVNAYRELVSCFGKDDAEQKYIDKNSLCDIRRFSVADPTKTRGRFSDFTLRDKWNECLDDHEISRHCTSRQTHSKEGKTVSYGGHPYEVRRSTRFSPRKKSTPRETETLKNKKTSAHKSAHSVEDDGFWYSKDVFEPKAKIENSTTKST